MASEQPRITRVFGAVNIGSFRVSAMIMGQAEGGEMVVLGSSHRASDGIKRGYVTDMRAASHAIRTAIEKAEANANTSIQSVWILHFLRPFWLATVLVGFWQNFRSPRLRINFGIPLQIVPWMS